MHKTLWHRLKNLQSDRALQIILIFAFILSGIILRLIWPADMEWKFDEKDIFSWSQRIVNGESPIPVAGAMSSALVRIPGMSIWFFALPGKFVDTPVALVQWVQWLNVVTLGLFTGFVFWQIPQKHHLMWLWGIAIASVNPLAILLSRRIWQPDVLAFFCFFIFLGHWFRKKPLGSFTWGLFGIFSAQLQMGGFFLVASLASWTFICDLRQKIFRKTLWFYWSLGTLVGGLPLIPWFLEVLPEFSGSRKYWLSLLFPKFYAQWSTTALGINLSFTLKNWFWTDFIQQPLMGGQPTFFMAIFHLVLVAIGIILIYQGAQRWLKRKRHNPAGDGDSQLEFYLYGVGLVGVLFALLRINVHPYYIAIAFPFPYLWLAHLCRGRLKYLLTITILQLLISANFLIHVHTTGGLPECGQGYGVSYRFQTEYGVPCVEDYSRLPQVEADTTIFTRNISDDGRAS